MKNWKTNLCGLIVALCTAVAPCLSDQWKPVAVALGGLVAAVGLLCAKDAGTPSNTQPPTGSGGA